MSKPFFRGNPLLSRLNQNGPQQHAILVTTHYTIQRSQKNNLYDFHKLLLKAA
ncbi:hypothetical protein [Vibrio azureus]|uniref:hypothetical protein n=1 Tax=Vibrio azureus TaxID=512649 RepID=UPI0003AA343D|nr:hypothetical protein [Vibrio azureus]